MLSRIDFQRTTLRYIPENRILQRLNFFLRSDGFPVEENEVVDDSC
jgi:hypothetical protein